LPDKDANVVSKDPLNLIDAFITYSQALDAVDLKPGVNGQALKFLARLSSLISCSSILSSD
jgi:hypothetical protein